MVVRKAFIRVGLDPAQPFPPRCVRVALTMPSYSTFKCYADRFLGPLCAIPDMDEAARSRPLGYRLALETRRTSSPHSPPCARRISAMQRSSPLSPCCILFATPERSCSPPCDSWTESVVWGPHVRRAILERVAVQARCGGISELSVWEDERGTGTL